MKMVVGLGNPGRRYSGTRHNVGFAVVDELARRHSGAVRESLRFPAETCDGSWGGQSVLLVRPTTFMNASGEAVGPLLRRKGGEAGEVVVVVDDLDLPLGRLRLRGQGGPGGHNGLKSITAHLGTDGFPRVRVGVGRPREEADVVDHVLSRFAPDEQVVMAEAVSRAADAVEVLLERGLAEAMNRFNA